MAYPKQEERFVYKGYPCVVLFMPLGYRCGYVGIPEDIKINAEDIDCHCGITYQEYHLYNQDDENTQWIGFDCGHCCDGFDTEAVKKYFADDSEVLTALERMKDFHQIVNSEHEVRTLEYVKDNCMKIVDQIIERISRKIINIDKAAANKFIDWANKYFDFPDVADTRDLIRPCIEFFIENEIFTLSELKAELRRNNISLHEKYFDKLEAEQ